MSAVAAAVGCVGARTHTEIRKRTEVYKHSVHTTDHEGWDGGRGKTGEEKPALANRRRDVETIDGPKKHAG